MKLSLEHFVQETIKKKLDLYHVVVRQHGEIVGQFDWRENRRDNIHSLSKSFLSLAVGMAVEEGILSLDERPAEIFKDKLPKHPSEHLKEMTIRNMIMMATGHDTFILQGYSASDDRPVRDAIENDDWIEYALQFEVPYQPGTYWKYNNFGPFLASVIIQDRTGESLKDWLKPRLFTPLGIKNPQWFEAAKGGYTLGCGGLHLSTEELSRFGQLLLNEGEWEGRQLVSAAWIREATSFQISNQVAGKNSHPDDCAGYGYFFWRCSRDHAYCGHGYGGQRIIVLPEQDACIAITAHEFNSGAIADCVWDQIVPLLKGEDSVH